MTRVLGPESRFTPPADWCQSPQRWHSTDADSTEVEVTELVAAMVRALQPDLVVETGTAWAQTAGAIGEALARNGHGRLVTCEPDPVRHAFCVDAVKSLPVTVVKGQSLELVPDGPVGFAWLDSLPNLRIPEFRHLRQWLSPGAVVGFHDTAPHKKLHRWLARTDAEMVRLNLRTPRGVTFAQVR